MTNQMILKEAYNATFDDVWKFVPRITSKPPYGASICLIWSLPKDYLLSPDFSYTVSMKLFQVEISYFVTKTILLRSQWIYHKIKALPIFCNFMKMDSHHTIMILTVARCFIWIKAIDNKLSLANKLRHNG